MGMFYIIIWGCLCMEHPHVFVSILIQSPPYTCVIYILSLYFLAPSF